MAICCAYCEQTFLDFCSYKVHLKVYHNKKTYGDKLICGQNCCPRDFTRFQTLKSHIIKVHNPLSVGTSVSCVSNKQCHVISNAVEVDELLTDDCDTEPLDTESKSTSGSSCLDYLRDNIDSKGVLYDAALFVSKLRSNPKITQTSVDEIIQSCIQQVIEVDFVAICRLNGYDDTCKNKLFEMWPKLTVDILNARPQARNLSGDDDLRAMQAMVQLTCSKRSFKLHKGAKRKAWCPSVSDCLNSFIIIAQSIEGAEDTLRYVRAMYTEMRLTVQPLVLCLPGNAMVAYNASRFVVESGVKAVDLCFKLIQILNLEYNVASLPAWIFLQRYVYGISSRWDVPSPKAAELAATLGL